MGVAAHRPRRNCPRSVRDGDRRRIVVVRAFVKKTQRTPRAEIELALRRAKEIT
jgi:hypothetical protein